MTVKRSVAFKEEIFEALLVQARVQRRSLSNVVELYLMTELVLPGVMVPADKGEKASEVIERAKPSGGTRIGRLAMCEHRIPPGSHCRVCDA